MYSSSGIHCPVEASITSIRSQVRHARVRAVPVNTAGVSSKLCSQLSCIRALVGATRARDERNCPRARRGGLHHNCRPRSARHDACHLGSHRRAGHACGARVGAAGQRAKSARLTEAGGARAGCEHLARLIGRASDGAQSHEHAVARADQAGVASRRAWLAERGRRRRSAGHAAVTAVIAARAEREQRNPERPRASSCQSAPCRSRSHPCLHDRHPHRPGPEQSARAQLERDARRPQGQGVLLSPRERSLWAGLPETGTHRCACALRGSTRPRPRSRRLAPAARLFVHGAWSGARRSRTASE